MTDYKYNFDGYFEGAACGWIYDTKRLDRRISIGIFVDDELLTVGCADLLREDLVVAGISDGHCAFCIPFDDSIDGLIQIKILPDKILLKGSEKQNLNHDLFTTKLIKKFRFEGYKQFSSHDNVAAIKTVFKYSERLARAFSELIDSGRGVEYTKHMEWVFSLEREGSASFFDCKETNPLEDIYWYLFSYKSSKPAFISNIWFFNPIYPKIKGMEYYTPACALWLHKNGIILDDMQSKHHYFLNFIGSLLVADTPVTVNILPRSYFQKTHRQLYLNNQRLPRLNNYGSIKHELSYSKLYDLSKPLDYLAYIFDICLHATYWEIGLMGDEILAFFNAPITIGDTCTTRFVYILWFYQMMATGEVSPALNLKEAIQVNIWFEKKWLPKYPQHIRFLPKHDLLVKTTCSCFIVALWDNETGLTKNAIMSANALARLGVPIIKLYPDGGVYEYGDDLVSTQTYIELKQDVVLIHVNADKVPETLSNISSEIDLDNAYVIGYFLWEIEKIPKCHELGISLVDEIWVPTHFVQSIYSPYAPKITRLVGKAITVPKIDHPNREKFNISPEKITFLISYDFHSCVERKNPLATLKAFQLAFCDRNDVQLVIKTTAYVPNHWGDPFGQSVQVQKIANSDERIIIIEDFLEQDELFELIACADVIVSSHRAEGFGYLPAYGLLYNKKVIATGYSGVTDFSEHPNMLMVNYQLTGLPNGKFIYQIPGGVWADIDVDDLAKKMLIVSNTIKNPTCYTKLNAIEDFKNYYSYERLSEAYKNAFIDAGLINTDDDSLA